MATAKPTQNTAEKPSKAKPPIGKRTRAPAAEVARIAAAVTSGPAVKVAPSELPLDPPNPSITVPAGRGEKTLQVNFKASISMAKVIQDEARKVGGTRILFAQLLRDAGHAIPDQDLRVFEFGGRRRNL